MIPKLRYKPKSKAERKREKQLRVYGGPERIKWVASLPCVIGSECLGPIENAHVRGGGMGYKAPANAIVPLCHKHHHKLHWMGLRTFERRYGTDLGLHADDVELRWSERGEAWYA